MSCASVNLSICQPGLGQWGKQFLLFSEPSLSQLLLLAKEMDRASFFFSFSLSVLFLSPMRPGMDGLVAQYGTIKQSTC